MHLSSASYVGCFICCIIGAARLLYFALTIVQVLLWINYLPELKNPNLPTQAPAAPSDDLLQLQGNPFANMMNGELGSAVQDITMKRYLNNEFFSGSSSSKLCPTSHFKLRASCRWVESLLINEYDYHDYHYHDYHVGNLLTAVSFIADYYSWFFGTINRRVPSLYLLDEEHIWGRGRACHRERYYTRSLDQFQLSMFSSAS